jgi:hypothetical protein
VIKKRIVLPIIPEKNILIKLYKRSLKAIENNQRQIKKEKKNKIIPVNLCDIERIDVI